MSAYISLFNFTDQGIRGDKNSAKQIQAVREATEAAGGRVIGLWWTLGQYDGFIVFEAPDDEATTRLLLQLAMRGNVRTVTMPCLSEEQIQRVVQGLT